MRTGESVLVGAVVAIAAGTGFVVARLTTDFPGRETVAETDDAPSPRTGTPARTRSSHAEPAPDVVPRRAAPPTGASPPTNAADVLRGLVPDAPPERLADADVRAVEVRTAAQRTVDEAERIAARQIADEIGRERAVRAEALRNERDFLDDRARGGTMAMLRALNGSHTHLFDLVGTPERFAGLFERRASGPSIEGPGVKGPIADGATITFPAGVHAWSVSSLGRGAPFPKDLLVVGAGIDSTVVSLDEFNADQPMTSLTFRDLTIDCADNYMFDVRGDAPVTLRLERCRVVGFDMGAGGSVMLSAPSAAFFASDSRFEAGFGDCPGSGNLFRVDSGILARMDRCTFVGPFSSVYDEGSDATYDFADCTFTNGGRDFEDGLPEPPAGVVFERCTAVTRDAAEIAASRVALLAKVTMAAGTPSDLYALLAKFHQSLAPLVGDSGALAALCESWSAGPRIDGASGTLSGPPPDAATVVFAGGVFEWDQGRRLPGFEGDLTLTGQGMDTTLVRLCDDLDCRRLRLADLTLDVGDGALPDDSDRLAVLRIERCRIVGFDTGAGGSTLFESSGPSAILAVDSRFEVGFGRSPSHGSLLRGGPAAARFERCLIRVPIDGLPDPREAESAYVFSGCRFVVVGRDRDDRDPFEEPQDGLVLTGCGVEYVEAATPGKDDARRLLSEINRSWPER